MKKKIFLLMALAVAAIGGMYYSHVEGCAMDELMIENVEALAAGEGGTPMRCVGYGCVDCPLGTVKVKYVMTGYSLD